MSTYKKLISFGTGTLLLSLLSVFSVTESSKLRAEEVRGNLTLEEIADMENVTVGEQVTVRGEAEEVEPGKSFVLEEKGFFGGDEVLVINVSGQMIPPAVEDDDIELQVTGEIAMLVVADVEREYGLDLDTEFYVEYESQPVILVKSMVLAPDVEDVAENPEDYYGQEIALQGEIDEVRSLYTFTLKEEAIFDDDELLVINATGLPIPEEDETVVVIGRVRPYIQAEFDRDYDLTWDLDIKQEIEAEYTEKPVLVIDRMYPSAEDKGIF